MTDLQPAPVPELSEEWIVSHQTALVDALSHRRRPPAMWAALAGATAVAAAVSTLIFVGGSQPRARLDAGPRAGAVQPPATDLQYVFAGWSPSPTTPANGQVSTADTACQTQLAKLRPSNKGTDAASLVPELSDVRGPYTVTVFGNGGQNAATCVSAPDSTTLRWITRSAAPVGAGAIEVDQVSTLTRDGQQYTLVEGRTGVGVTGVVLALGNGSEVTATSGNGVLVAWWPGSQSVTSATVATATGVSTQPLNLAGPGNPPPTKSSPLPPGTQPSSSGSVGPSTVCLIQSCR